MAVAERGDRRVRYATQGDGPTVLLIPGLGSGARLFGTLPRRFVRAGFRCVDFDPVGVAPSSPHSGDYHLDEAARDVLAVLDDAAIERVSLVATSLGGKVALHVAQQAPERVAGMALLASSAVATPRARRIYRFFQILAERLEPPQLAEILATFLFGSSFHNRHPKVVGDIVRAMKLDDPTRALMIAQAQCLHTFDGSQLVREVTCPCLCFAGAEDTLTGVDEVRATAELLPNGHFHLVEGAGHSLLLEAAEVFDRVAEFLGALA
ncbi:MAG: alpha/beta fold hydrolase [Planctomycetes bacterium]|nr:alpha/beta fold hydrolase [Planctomycetota bacterium]